MNFVFVSLESDEERPHAICLYSLTLQIFKKQINEKSDSVF